MPASVFKRLGLSKEEFRDLLVTKYIKEENSQRIISEQIGYHEDIIRKWFKKFCIPVRTFSDAIFLGHQRNKRHVNISSSELEVLNGLMLGDGHLSLSTGLRSARYTHGCKYKETLLGIAKELPSLSFCDPFYSNGYWYFKSLAYAQLLSIHKRWYGNGLKLVPKDISLTPNCCYHWFIGDGCQSKSRYDIQLSTDSFSNDCLDTLVNQFKKLGIKVSKTANNRLLISAQDVPKFYNFIGQCRNPEYKYKWQYNPPKWTFQRNSKRGTKWVREL